MKAVKFHQYAKRSGAEIYDDPIGEAIAVLPANSWIGVMHEIDGWYHVVTTQLNGWIRIDDCVSGKHFTLTPKLPKDRSQPTQNYLLTA